jgi:hypothetical protein
MTTLNKPFGLLAYWLIGLLAYWLIGLLAYWPNC